MGKGTAKRRQRARLIEAQIEKKVINAYCWVVEDNGGGIMEVW